MNERMRRIVPTVWLRNDQEFYNLVSLFKDYGIEELRVNCTRHDINLYIQEITKFNTWCVEKLKYTFKIILDIPVPNKKTRIFYKSDGKGKYINKNEIFNIFFAPQGEMIPGNNLYIFDYALLKKLNVNDHLYVGDMGLELVVISIKGNMVVSKCVCEGELGYGKYVLTDKIKYQSCCIDEIEPYIEMCNILEPEMVAFSFVNDKHDIQNIITRNEWMCKAKLIAKIETEEGYDNLQDIISMCKFVMVARGDLLNNVGQEKFAKYACDIVEYCEKKHIDNYVATGILNSVKDMKNTVNRAELLDAYTLLKKEYSKIILTHGVCKDLEVANQILSLINKIEI